MMTSKQLTLQFAEEKLTLSPEDSRVNHSQQPESEKAQQITGTSGRKCLEQFGRLVPDGSWAKTFSELLIGTMEWYSSKCTLTWKLKATKSSRLYFQLVASTLRTCDTERGLLPTVQTQGLKVCKEGKTVFMPTTLLPTPTRTDWNTPLSAEQAERYRAKKPNAQALKQLRQMAADGLLPTPKANDYRSGMANRVGGKHTQQLNDAMAYHADQTSQLNPLFVQEMMGFPHLWTELPFQSGEQKP